MNRIHKKMQNYHDANVKVVWHIFPELAEVYVYTGKNLDLRHILKGQDLVTAAPLLPQFSITVNDIFKIT